jgi:hypothetical protein
MTARFVVLSLAAAAALLGQAPPPAAPKPAAAKAKARPIPRTDDDKPDFSGIWIGDSRAAWSIVPSRADYDTPGSPGFVEGGSIPYTPAALKQREANAQNPLSDPMAECHMAGVPRSLYVLPWKLIQKKEDITILYEHNHGWRLVHMDGRPHLDDLEMWMGDSTGTWDGETLVVDVADFNGKAWFDMAGNFAGPRLHIVERYRMVDGDTMEYQATMEDPDTYTRPWKLKIPMKRAPAGFRLQEFECTEEADRIPPR